MKIQEALAQAVVRLESESIDSPRLDAELLLAHVLEISRATVLTWPERRLTPKALTQYRDLVGRRAARIPLPYILGHWEFFGLDLLVDSRVLIPRPETELLVEQALERAKRWGPALRVCDVGAGSGAIAISLAVHLPQATIYALDGSPEALEVTAHNARRHGVADRVQCMQGDLLAPLPEPVHIITANLPYVTTEEWSALPPEIRQFEPRQALDGGPDGLDLIRALLAAAPPLLQPGGSLLLEIGASQGDAVSTLARQEFPQARVQIQPDYAGLDRMVLIEP